LPAIKAVLAFAIVAPLASVGITARTTSVPVQVSRRYVLEQATRARWMNGGQRAEFTPFAQAASTLDLDVPAIGAGASERTIRVDFRPGIGDSASLTSRPDGSIVRQSVWLRPLPPSARLTRADSARMARFRLREGGSLQLPAARLWDVVPRVHPRRFARGERWTDTIALETEYDGARQALTGLRTSVLVGDTTVDGRQLWIVHDSANVRYTDHELEEELTLDTLVSIDRTASGVIRGQYLFDRGLGLFASRVDTTSLIGDAVLRYPDGRSFHTPTRYERTRQWTLFEPAAYAARQAEKRAETQRVMGGMVRAPASETERRLSSGDAVLRDSLIDAWIREVDPDRKLEIYRELVLWAPGRQQVRDSLDARRVAAGDTAFYLELLGRRAYPAQRPIDRETAQEMIRVMRDPAIPFSFGVSRDVLYGNLTQTFVTWPPALDADTTRRRCLPDACRLLEEQWRVAREPRLRDVGLTVLATTDPARWADTVLSRVAADPGILTPVAQLMNGVGATWPAAAKLSLPGPDADWRAWLAWTSATSPEYRLIAAPMSRGMQPELRFEESHVTAIRFYQQRTGRDVVGEIRRSLAAATDDSARLVYGAILTGLGDVPTVDQVAARFRSGSAAQIALATRQLYGLFRGRVPLAD
jgi:hypothetical protein